MKSVYIFFIFIVTTGFASAQQRVNYSELSRERKGYFYNGKPFTGTIVSREGVTDIPIEWTVINGIPNGVATWFFDEERTKVKKQVPLVKGFSHGLSVTYNEDGSVSRMESIKKNKMQGKYYAFNKDGEIIQSGIYQKGNRRESRSYYNDGTLKKIENHKNHSRHGYFIQYSQESRVEQTGYYKKGYRHGTWKTYDTNGTVTKTERYKKDKLVK